MTSREQFETWANKLPSISITGYLERHGDQYLDDYHCSLWSAWQASRAAVEIKLPAKNDIHDEDRPIPDLSDWDDGRNSGIQECAESIRTAGIKVKDC
ncbi:hypothetical protein [uncultured Citrobacter sp.]|uniref:hypothetical protein n=1 Tax=uncultured Citrobacter sp. TaxID=200446 RepID=UPI00266C4E2E|nr:hypothetical protein [uncultured Citrobacter sp.]